jgi:hypothetical protein
MRKSISTCGFLLLFATAVFAQSGSSILRKALSCDDQSGVLCAEVFDSIGYGGAYTGHDEPSVLFYSNVAGAGNTGVYLLQLPKDPPTLPKQDGTGGTFNFQLRPAMWVGMALCDDQSAPNPGGSSVSANIPCTPDSDGNIFDGSDPTKPDYIGKHPGTAFMEMQFYPPGWLNGNDPTRWTSALNIDSLSQNLNTGANQNGACQAAAVGGIEYVNFAFITKDGVPTGPPSPLLANGNTFTPNADTLFYNPGDVLRVVLQDTTQGLKIKITDLTTGETGFMTASAANGFAEILFDPKAKNCNLEKHNLQTNFHPVYATSSEHTRVPWAAHSYNIAFSDEIGHFEYCSAVSSEGGACTSSGASDPPGLGLDENFCFDAAFASSFGLIPIGGCLDTDIEFDGVPYQLVWPGTGANTAQDQQFHPGAVLFTSPLFTSAGGRQQNYSRVAFEADLPRIEFATNPPCQRHFFNPADPNPGAGCVNPPVGANFYPFYSVRGGSSKCTWQLGGASIPGTTNSFGGSSTTEFGSLLLSAYPAANGQPTLRYNNFRNVLSSNPCPSSGVINTP